MKNKILIPVLSLVLFVACSDNKDRYVDLGTGKAITIEKDKDGFMFNTETKEPVYMYVDTKKQ